MLLGVLGGFAFVVPLAAAGAWAPRAGVLRHVAALAVLAAWGLLASGGLLPANAVGRSPGVVQVVAQLEEDYGNATFIVSGYAGYAFVAAAGEDPEHKWVHTMHLQPEMVQKVVEDYPGRKVMLLVNASELAERWLGPESRIPERFLYLAQVGPWTLFEVVVPD